MYPINHNGANSPIKFDNFLKDLIPQMQYDNPKVEIVHEISHPAHSLNCSFLKLHNQNCIKGVDSRKCS